MLFNSVSELLLSLGGSAAIILSFAKIFEKILIDQVSKRTASKLELEFETLKSNQRVTLEELKAKANINIKDREIFNTISLDTYQEFFKKRIEVYKKIVEWKNVFIGGLQEDFLVEYTESYGEIYNSGYVELRELLTQNQLYISNDLDECFQKLRNKAAEYLKRIEYQEMLMERGENNRDVYGEKIADIYHDFAKDTYSLMDAILEQINKDISNIRSRVEVDKA